MNVLGIASNPWTFQGQIKIFTRKKYNKLVQVNKYIDTVDFGMSNTQESILVVKPFLKQLQYIKDRPIARRFALFPGLTS